MQELLLFFITFLFVYFIYLFFIILRKKGIKKYQNSMEVKLLKEKYHLTLESIKFKNLAHITALINAFIIALVVTCIGFIKSLLVQLLVGFFLLIPLILLCYGLLAKILKKKEGKSCITLKK